MRSVFGSPLILNTSAALLVANLISSTYGVRAQGVNNERRFESHCSSSFPPPSLDFDSSYSGNATNGVGASIGNGRKRPSSLQSHSRAYWEHDVAKQTSRLQNGANDLKALIRRGRDYVHLGQTQLSVIDLSAAAKLDPNNPEIYFYRGIAHATCFDKAECSKAIRDYCQCLKLQPSLGMQIYATRNRGLCFAALGNSKKANTDFAKAEELRSRMHDFINPQSVIGEESQDVKGGQKSIAKEEEIGLDL